MRSTARGRSVSETTRMMRQASDKLLGPIQNLLGL